MEHIHKLWIDIQKINGSHLGSKDFGLWEHRWYTNIQSDIIFVNKSTGFSTHLAHYPWTNGRDGASVIFTYISRIVAERSEHCVCGIRYKSMRPKVFSPRIEIGSKLQNWISQLQLNGGSEGILDQRKEIKRLEFRENTTRVERLKISLFDYSQQFLSNWTTSPSCWTQA